MEIRNPTKLIYAYPNLTDDQSNKSRILIQELFPATTKSIYAISFDLLPILLSTVVSFKGVLHP